MGEVLESDYWHAKRNMAKEASEMFQTGDMSERDYMNATKNLTTRMRLNRDIQFNKEFQDKYITKEYGNYDKYTKNTVEIKQDEENAQQRDDLFYQNYTLMMKKLPSKSNEVNKENHKKGIEELIQQESQTAKEFTKELIDWKMDKLDDPGKEEKVFQE